jgi:mannose-1-phosphate guanylyltransferase / mannose-6-phosphate isomerase
MHEIVDPERLKLNTFSQINPIILSGGSGTRLWPLSRASLPKQFLPLVSDKTMFQETVLRNLTDAGFGAPIVACNEDHRFVIAEQLGQIGVAPRQILLESESRNTGPALAVAALWLVEQEPDAIMLVQPADHVIGSVANMHEVVFRGLAAARDGRLVIFGAKPSRPDPGYGYIGAGAPIDASGRVLAVDRFIEKPDAEAAQRLIASGLFYWNSGIFLFGAKHYLDELERLHPTMLNACRRALSQAKADHGFLRLDAGAFREAPALSIDKAVMEHTDRAAVLLVDMAWSDVGCWHALREAIPADEQGNIVRGTAVLNSTRNSYIHADSKLVATIGLDDIIVVSTDDAVLVAKADHATDVSAMVKQLQAENRIEAVQHTTSYRPWGNFKTVDRGDRFQVKRITVKPGGKLSLQKHFHRAEHWVVVQGTALVQRGQETMLIAENQSVYIPVGTEHRLENPGKVPLHLIEVQSGSYLGEDDIVRLVDGYGRT